MTASELPNSDRLVAMDVGSVLHMNEGLGETSYAQNSYLQMKSLEALKHIIVDSAMEVYASKKPKSFMLADLGCSSGLNALSLAKDIIIATIKKCHGPPPEFFVLLNDLPSNDFNVMFESFPEFIKKVSSDSRGEGSSPPSVFLAGVPGSFYGRLFPSDTLHFISSCYSLHWLSQVPSGLLNNEGKPINKGKMYISHTSPPSVARSYFKQFQKDFNLFLKSRSAELTYGGQIVLTMLGRKTQDYYDKSTTLLWDLLAQSFTLMVSQGLIEEEKVDTYNVPFYAPCINEIEDEVLKEGSFTIGHKNAYELTISGGDFMTDGKNTSMAIRAIQESMICHHFGKEIIDTLFQNYSRLLTEAMENDELKGVHLIIVLKKEHKL